MKQVINALIAMTCIAFFGPDLAQAQQPGTVSVGVRNRSETNVLVKGYTIVNGAQRSGQVLPLKKNGAAFETNVPPGVRYYTIYDANQPGRVILRDFRVNIKNRDVLLSIVRDPNNPNALVIILDAGS